MFVGNTVDQYSGMLASKFTPAFDPEVSAISENVKGNPYQSESQSRGQPIETTIAALADLDPTDG